MERNTQAGMNLIELLVAITIVAILASVAYPSYTKYVTSSRRQEAYANLLNLQTLIENYFIANGNYTSATMSNLGPNGTAVSTTSTPNGYYTLSLSTTSSTYTLTATATGTQATNDPACATLTIDNTGTKNSTGTGGSASVCWGQS